VNQGKRKPPGIMKKEKENKKTKDPAPMGRGPYVSSHGRSIGFALYSH
jgi:hypothetical protein